jgi:hypothetical protein
MRYFCHSTSDRAVMEVSYRRFETRLLGKLAQYVTPVSVNAGHASVLECLLSTHARRTGSDSRVDVTRAHETLELSSNPWRAGPYAAGRVQPNGRIHAVADLEAVQRATRASKRALDPECANLQRQLARHEAEEAASRTQPLCSSVPYSSSSAACLAPPLRSTRHWRPH